MKNNYIRNMFAMLAVVAFNLFSPQTALANAQSSKFDAKAGTQKTVLEDDPEWKYLGKGKYRDDIFSGILILQTFYEWEVDVYENVNTPGYYRLKKPYVNYPLPYERTEEDEYLVIHAEDPQGVYFGLHDTGIWNNQKKPDGEPEEPSSFVIYSLAGKYVDEKGVEAGLAVAKKEKLAGSVKHGVITFPKDALLVRTERFKPGIYKFGNASGMFRLILPGAPDLEINYYVDLANLQQDSEGNNAVNVIFDKFGQAVTKVKLAMIEGDKYEPSMATGIADGSIPSIEVTQGGSALLKYDKDGTYVFVAVPYYNDEVLDPIYKVQKLTLLENINWSKVGWCMYTDGFIGDSEWNLNVTGTNGYDSPTYRVQVEQHKTNVGVFRIVNPFGPGYQWYRADKYDSSRNWYIVINASKHDKVIIEKSVGVGLNIPIDTLTIWSRASRALEGGATEEKVMSDGLFGTLDEDGVITFPKSSLLTYFRGPQADPDLPYGIPYRSNQNGKFRLELPANVLLGIKNTEKGFVDSKDVQYFTLEGVRVNANNLKPGLYIRKIGGRSVKIMIQ